MKSGFYPKLAWSGIRKNGKFYIPYILTGVGMVTMYYIISFLSWSPLITSLKGGASLSAMLYLGSHIIVIFSAIFLFYTNSFIIKRRKKEFGLYNILGMGKWNIGRILFCESLITAFISCLSGIVIGITLSKFFELALLNIMRAEINFAVTVSFRSILNIVFWFAVIYFLIFLNDLRQLRHTNPSDLLKSENAGEKPPKANWFFGVAGVAVLAAAYWLAVTINNPIAALEVFFLAVIMVIIASYLIFISGSVLLCKILQKRKKYYYKPNHFISVSSMMYRMKRNGAGLASICILATMVLVILSTTTCLYFGENSALDGRYPRDICVDVHFDGVSYIKDGNIDLYKNAVTDAADKKNSERNDTVEYVRASVSGTLRNGVVETDASNFDLSSFQDIVTVNMITLEDYNRINNTEETLGDGEILLATLRTEYSEDFINLNVGESETRFHIKKRLSDFPVTGDSAMDLFPTLFFVVRDLENTVASLDIPDENGNRMFDVRWYYAFNTSLDEDSEPELRNDIFNSFKNLLSEGKIDRLRCSVESKAENRVDFYSTFGGLLYLGVLLCVVFVFAAVLIIYYKQISEGYEDASRFEIMQKVGMTKREIRKSINSQLLTVFFLPLIFSGIHLCFAFPIIHKLLMLFNLFDGKLFAFTTVISFLCFTVLYMMIYKITSNAYYSIVSGSKRKEA